MAETLRSQVTITLGRSGQVVKRAGDELDSAFSNSHPTAGSKRSICDRLGTNVGFNNKRHRGNSNRLSTSSADGIDDRLRRRSPDGVFGTSRGASLQRNEEQSRRRPIIRAYDDVRSDAYLSKDGLELSRPMGITSYMAKPVIAAGPTKHVAPMLATPPPPVVIVHKSSYTRKLAQRSERVKFVDLHSTEPWILAILYSGTVCIWNCQS